MKETFEQAVDRAFTKVLKQYKKNLKTRPVPEWWPQYFPMPKSPKVLPLGNRLCITDRPERIVKKDLQKVGGVFLPESGTTGKTAEPYYIAEVLAVGPDCKTVKRGDKVIVPRGLDWKVEIDGKVLAIMCRENEIHGCVR